MRVKKSDIFKIIQEELGAVRRALPAWLGEEVEDEDVFFDQDYDAGFKRGGEGSSTSQTLAYQLGAFDRENGLEYNPSEHPPRGPLANVREAEQDFAAPALSPNDIRFMLEKTWKRIEDKSARQGGGIDPHQMEASDAIDMVLDEANPKMDWVIQFLHMDSSQQENMMQNAMGQVHGAVPIVNTENVGKQRDYSHGDEEDDDHPYAHKDPVENPKEVPAGSGYRALVKLGEFLAKLENEGHSELANELDQVIVQMKNAGLNEAELQLEPGMQVKNIDTDQVGTVQSVKAGAGGGGAVIKLDDGTIEEWEASSLEPAGGVEEASFMIGDREVQLDEPADYPSPDEFAQLPSGEQQEIFDRALADYKENRRDMDPREDGEFQERLTAYERSMEGAAVTEGGAVGDTGDPYKQGDPSVQDGWSTDELIEFLQKHPSGVTPKEMAMAFGGQWQAHAAKLQKLVTQGILKKDVKTTMGKFKNRYVLADVNETLRDIFGFNTLGEEADQGGGKEEVLRRIVADGQAAEVDGVLVDPKSASIIVKVLDEIDDSNKEKLLAIDPGSMVEFAKKISTIQERDQLAARLREKAMRQLEGHPQGKLPPAPDADIPQEDVERVISFLQDQRDAGVGELDLSSIMQDMGMELDIVKLIMVDRLGYEIEASESDPMRGKINFDQGVDTMGEKLRHQYPDDEDDDDDDTDERGAPPGYGPVDEAGIGNIEVGDHVDVMGSAIAGAAGEVLELTKTTQGDPALVVRLTKAANSKLYGGIGDEVIVKPDFVELSALPGDKRPQPGEDSMYDQHYTEAHEPGHEASDDLAVGDDVIANGYPGTVTDLNIPGMVTVDLGRQGEVTVSRREVEVEEEDPMDDFNYPGSKHHYQEAACNKLREHVGRFMKVTLREEARNK